MKKLIIVPSPVHGDQSLGKDRRQACERKKVTGLTTLTAAAITRNRRKKK